MLTNLPFSTVPPVLVAIYNALHYGSLYLQ